jgi:ribosomal protein S18 acetylase RimI-like enzyme
MATITVRPLTSLDVEAFREIRLEALERVPRAFAESAEEFRATSVETVAARLGQMGAHEFLLGAFDGPQLIGTAGFARGERLKDRHKGRVWGVYVRKDSRAKGVGRQLLSELVRRAFLQAGLEHIILTVGTEQASAKRLYASLGFEVFGRERHALKVGETYVDEDYMVFTKPEAPTSG